MFAHVQALSRPGQPPSMSGVPSVEDGSLAQLLCLCSPDVCSGQLFGPQGMGGLPREIPMQPPTVLVNAKSKTELWECCERAVGAFHL